MPASKKPRKKYRPKGVFADPVGYATESVTLLREHGDYYQSWLLKNHAAADMLVRGLGTKVHIDTLMASHNIVCALVALMKYPDDTGVVAASEAALLALGRRGAASGQFTMYAAEIAAMNNMLSLHDEFLACVTVREMEDAIKFAKRECVAGRRSMILETVC